MNQQLKASEHISMPYKKNILWMQNKMLIMSYERGLDSIWRRKREAIIPHADFIANYIHVTLLPTSNAFHLLLSSLCFTIQDNLLKFNVVTGKKKKKLSFQSYFLTWLSFFHRLRIGESSAVHISLSNLQPALTDLLSIRSFEMTWALENKGRSWRRINKNVQKCKEQILSNLSMDYTFLHTYHIYHHLLNHRQYPYTTIYLSLIQIKLKSKTFLLYFSYHIHCLCSTVI